LLDRHLFLDRAFHAFEPDAELIFEQFADGTHAAVAEVVDVILIIIFAVAFHPQKVIYDLHEIRRLQKRVVRTVIRRSSHFDVELQTADTRKIETAFIKEHSFEQVISRRNGRRIAGTHLAVYFEQRIDRFGDRVFLQRVRYDLADNVAFREKDRK